MCLSIHIYASIKCNMNSKDKDTNTSIAAINNNRAYTQSQAWCCMHAFNPAPGR